MSAVKAGEGRPTKGYFLEDGTRVPSVTTITGRFKDSGGLIRWAWKEGRDGRELYEARDKAAEAGSICHGWIEHHIHGRGEELLQSRLSTPPGDTFDQAQQGFNAFLEWAEQSKLEVLETETPLVSELHRYGGTFDALALIAGKPKLLDWKTSNAVYGEYVVQIAAYRQLLRERGEEPIPDSAQLLRIGKTHADFHLHSYPPSVLDMGWTWFLHAREMYAIDKDLKGVAA